MVAVGDSAEVELIFTSNKGQKGTFEKKATVTCNDNDRGNFPLTLKAKGYEFPDSLTPMTIAATRLAYDSLTRSKELKLKVKNVSKNKVKLSLVSFPYGYLKVDIPDSDIKPGKDKDIKVKIDPMMTEMNFKKSFTFEVNDSVHTRYTVPVTFEKVIAPPVIQPPPEKKVATPLPATTSPTPPHVTVPADTSAKEKK